MTYLSKGNELQLELDIMSEQERNCDCFACTIEALVEATKLKQQEYKDTEGEKAATQPRSKSAQDYLEEAARIQAERGTAYDSEDGEKSAGKTAMAFNAITGHNLTESEVWLLLQVLKDVRQWTTTYIHEDSALDSVSYAALKAESLNKSPTTYSSK